MAIRHCATSLLLVTLALPGFTARAADTSLSISGKIISAACTVDTALETGLEVNLGEASNIRMQNAGDAGAWKPFTLNLVDCPWGTDFSTVTFTGTADADDATLFANTEPAATAAKKAAVQMAKDADRSQILSDGDSWQVAVGADRKVTFPLAARLYTPTGRAEAGKVSSSVTVDFTYQ